MSQVLGLPAEQWMGGWVQPLKVGFKYSVVTFCLVITAKFVTLH